MKARREPARQSLPKRSLFLQQTVPSDGLGSESVDILKQILECPLADYDLISQRHNNIEYFMKYPFTIDKIGFHAKRIHLPKRARKYNLLINNNQPKNNAAFWLRQGIEFSL